MVETRTCKQCGEIKPISNFRKYYGGRKGNYRTCKFCEKVNAREKYLNAKEELSSSEQTELDKIHQLWDVQRAAGWMPPNTSTRTSVTLVDSIAEAIGRYAPVNTEVSAAAQDVPVPAELQSWLQCDLDAEPDYYLDEVYESLRNKYRPMLRVDNGVAVYDDTYKEPLAKVLERFYEYEDNYYVEG